MDINNNKTIILREAAGNLLTIRLAYEEIRIGFNNNYLLKSIYDKVITIVPNFINLGESLPIFETKICFRMVRVLGLRTNWSKFPIKLYLGQIGEITLMK